MLKQRIITALILVSLVLWVLFANNPLYWQLFISLIVLIGFWEWIRFCQIDNVVPKIVAYIVFTMIMLALQSGVLSIQLVILMLCVLWLVLIIFTTSQSLNFLHHPFIKLSIGLLILPMAAYLVIQLKNLPYALAWILCFFVSVWAADVGAYFMGKRFGKTKLAPTISPGKTVEGLIGGLGLVLIIYTPLLLIILPSYSAAFLLLIAVLVTSIVSVIGDLFISKLKRFADLKDSSQILPGHGGVLDRIDSLLSGAPFFMLGLWMLGYLN